MKSETKKPFNPWPTGIIAFFAVAISGAVVWISFCVHHSADLVTADYYEQEVRYQDQLDRIHRAASLEAPATVAYDEASRRIKITLPSNQLRNGVKGWIQLYRPSSAKLDQKFELKPDTEGGQVIDAASLSAGLWHVRISWTANGTDYFCDQKVIVGEKTS